MTTEGQQQKDRSFGWILRFFSNHPLFGFISFLGAIASIVTLLFPSLTSPKSELAFCVSPTRTPIIKALSKSEISVSYKGKPLPGDVTAAQVAIWNQGRQPIKGEDILSPIILHTSSNAPILEASLLQTTRSASEFRMDINQTNLMAGRVAMNWKILQKKDAALIQILYSGTTEQPIRLDGEIVGQDLPRNVKAGTITTFPFVLLLGCSCAVLLVIGKGLSLLIDKVPNKPTIIVLSGLFAMAFFTFATTVVFRAAEKIYHSQSVVTPFGF